MRRASPALLIAAVLLGGSTFMCWYAFREKTAPPAPGGKALKTEGSPASAHAVPVPPKITNGPKQEDGDLLAFASDDLRAEMLRLADLTDSAEAEDAWMALAQRLAGEHPEEGLRWLLSLPKTDSTTAALTVFGVRLFALNRELALSLLDQLLADPLSHQKPYRIFAAEVLKSEVSRSFEDGMALLEKLVQTEQGAQAGSYLMGLGARLVGTHDDQTMLKLAAKFPAQVEPVLLGESLFRVWKSDLRQAQQLIDAVADEARFANTFNILAAHMAAENATATAEWIQSMPPGPARDGAAMGFARNRANTDPLDAARHTLMIEDARMREASGSIILSLSAGKDLAATEALIQSSPTLTEDEKAYWIGHCWKTYQAWQR